MGLFGKSKKAAAEPQGAQATGMPVQGAQAQPSGMAAQGMQGAPVQMQGMAAQMPNAAAFDGAAAAGDAAVQDTAQVVGAVGTVPAGAASAFETPGLAMGAVQPQDMASSQPATGVAAAQQFQGASQTPQAFQPAQAEPAEQPAAQADPQPAVRRTQSLSELAAAREQLMAKLGESVYPLLKEVPEVQIGREDLFSRIAKLDEQVAKAEARAAYEQETRRLQELQRRQAQERAQREEEERQAQAQAQQQAQQQQAQQAFAEQQPLAQQQEPAQQAQPFAQQTVSQPQTSASYPGFGQQQGAQQQAGVAGQQQGMQQQAAEQPPVQQYRCPRCGNPVDQHAPFCGYCGCLFQTSEQG